MPIQFNSLLSSNVANQTFLDKTIDDLKRGKLTLYKNLVSDSDTIDDVQDYINQIADTIGQVSENDPNRKLYSSHNIISVGDDRKVAIGKLDAQAFTNAESIGILNNLILDGAIKIKSYISDSAYESANGAPTGGEIYYNTTTGLIRYFNGIDSVWQDVGKQVLAVQEVPTGLVNGINTSFDLASSPLNEEAINLYVDGLIIPKSKWSFASPTITLVDAPQIGQDVYVSYLSDGNPSTPIVSAGTQNVVYLELTATDISNGFALLPSVPNTPSQVMIDIVGGTTAVFGTDFSMASNQVNWSSLNLDGLLATGDILRVQYFN